MPNILGMYDEGYASGRNQAGQTIIDNALANYSADPRAASAQIMRVNPQLATTLQQEADRQQGQADERRLGALYATNPLQARNEAIGMGRFDLADHFGKLDEQGRAQSAQGLSVLSNVVTAFRRRSPDPTERRNMALHFVDQLAGMPGMTPDQIAQMRAEVERMGWDDASLDNWRASIAGYLPAADTAEVDGSLVNTATGEVVYTNPLRQDVMRAQAEAYRASAGQREASADFTRRRPVPGAGGGRRSGGGGGGGGRGGGATYSDLPPGARVVR